MMRRRTAGQSNLEAPRVGPWLGSALGWGVTQAVHQGPSSTGRDITHLSCILITLGLFFTPQQPAL